MMKLNLKKTGRNTKAGLLVIACSGLIAAFAGSPYKGTRVTLDATDLAGIVQREVDHVNPVDLADWISQRKIRLPPDRPAQQGRI